MLAGHQRGMQTRAVGSVACMGKLPSGGGVERYSCMASRVEGPSFLKEGDATRGKKKGHCRGRLHKGARQLAAEKGASRAAGGAGDIVSKSGPSELIMQE
ncbi:hypothetical protein GOP47_0002744 [Adiantum capillus-veneris]|uniref:Uncharacterized protein n=1 Tax=Adiantum capillus-veneris TaxID=13818 RepID=A0A9D4VC66_ADICA|nr:hypothetical protein GOP47_0002744 [Adiantum capillus-veneris]